MNSKTTDLDILTRREIALAAMVDHRTLDRALTGLKVRPICLYRIHKALSERGLASALPKQGDKK